MSKRNKKKNKRTGNAPRKRPSKQPAHRDGRRMTGRLSDPSGRGFPTASHRKRIIESIRAIPSEQRAPEDWYALGSLLVYDACLEDDDSLMNEGNEALVIAADFDPPVPDAILDLTWLLNLRGLPAMSLPYAKRATELLVDRPDAWRFRANTHLQLKQRDLAIECLRKAVALPSSIPSDKKTLAKLESGEDQVGGRGVICFSTPFEEQPLHHSQEGKSEQIKLQLFYCRQLLQLMPDDSDTLYMTAMGHYHLQQFDEAERHLAQLFAVDEGHADGLCIQALIHKKKRGDLEKAAEFYGKAIQANPDHVLANSNLAKILMDEHGQVHEARLLLEAALEADPNYAPALSMYGNTIAHLESDFKRESEYHAKAIKYGPALPEFRFCYIISLLQAGEFWQLKKEWKKHGPYLARWAQVAPETPFLKPLVTIVPMILEPPSDFGTCVVVAEQCTSLLGGKALSPLLQQAWKLRHSIPDEEELRLGSYGWLGMVAGHCEQYELALEVFREAEKLEGKRGDASLNVAVTLGNLKRFDEAIELANSVEPGTSRAASIQANILHDAGRREEALEKYLLASQTEKDFVLPVANGMKIAVKLGDISAIKRLEIAAKENFGHTPDGQHAHAQARLALGFPSEAAEILCGLLYKDGEPHGLPEVAEDDEAEEPDLTLLGGLNENATFFTLALSFLKSRQFGELIRLGDWMQEERSIHGDWNVLVAEANRYLGSDQKALEIVDGMTCQPPPLATKALIAAAEGDWETVRDVVNEILSGQFTGMEFFHPEGDPRAVGLALRSLNMLLDGYPNEAIEEARRALKADPTCGLAYTSLARAYDESGETTRSIDSAIAGLQHVPGDLGLLEWVVLRLIDQRKASQADEILANYREHLDSRGMSQVGSWLGEQVARAKLPADSAKRDKLDEAWIAQLEPQSQEWLNAAVAGNEKVSDLRLGIAIYYCKIVERELTSKLVQPFIDSRPATGSGEFDRDLKDFTRCLDTGRMPGLGSIAHALGVAARPGRYDDSVLLRSWRAYLQALPDSQKSAVRSREFIDTLRTLADVRNRVAHLGDLTHDEFLRVEGAVLNNRVPGIVLNALGIS
jgi:tetratricopeptide (TPR) repeat protein